MQGSKQIWPKVIEVLATLNIKRMNQISFQSLKPNEPVEKGCFVCAFPTSLFIFKLSLLCLEHHDFSILLTGFWVNFVFGYFGIVGDSF